MKELTRSNLCKTTVKCASISALVNTHIIISASVCCNAQWDTQPSALKINCSHKTATGQRKETLTASILIHFQLLVCLYGFASVSDRGSISQRRRGDEEGGGSILIIKQVSWMNILCGTAAAVFVLFTKRWTNGCSRRTSYIFTGCLWSKCIAFSSILRNSFFKILQVAVRVYDSFTVIFFGSAVYL